MDMNFRAGKHSFSQGLARPKVQVGAAAEAPLKMGPKHSEARQREGLAPSMGTEAYSCLPPQGGWEGEPKAVVPAMLQAHEFS